MMLSGYIVALNPAPYYSPYVVMLIAVAVCAVIGLINGVLINYANIPSLVVTLLTGFIVRYTCMLVTDAQNLMLTEKSILWLGQPLGAFLLLSIALVIAFFTILPSKLGTPLYRRDKRHPVSYMFAYAISGVIAGLAGIFVLARISAAGPSFGSGYEPFILLVYGCAAGSRALDNRIAPALYALAPALLYALVSNILILFGFSPLTQSIILGGLALVFILVAYLVRPELRGKILMPKQ
jgi:ribose/xylose/arabinose/galactoside ABC-type transport system permease subunit